MAHGPRYFTLFPFSLIQISRSTRNLEAKLNVSTLKSAMTIIGIHLFLFKLTFVSRSQVRIVVNNISP